MVSSAQGISWATRFSPKPGSFMFCVRQLSTLLIISALIYVGLLFANLLSGVVSTWVTWAALTACMIVGASVILCVLTPKSVLKLQFQNCIRLDGSWSQGRQNAEATKQLKLFREIVFAITVVVVPTIFTLWIVNRDIVPIDIGVKLAADKISRPANQQANIDAMAKESINNWYDNKLTSKPGGRKNYRGWLKNLSPFMLIAACLWFFGCVLFVGKFYIYSIDQLRRSAITRGQAYYWRDLGNQSEQIRERPTKRKPKRQKPNRCMTNHVQQYRKANSKWHEPEILKPCFDLITATNRHST